MWTFVVVWVWLLFWAIPVYVAYDRVGYFPECGKQVIISPRECAEETYRHLKRTRGY